MSTATRFTLMARASVLALGATLACALPALAQAPSGPGARTGQAGQTDAAPSEEAQQVEEVVVTGTSIRGVAAVGSPAVNLDHEAITATGAANMAAVVRTLPVVLNIGPDESRTGGGQDAGANATRISAINLRGLGPEATLLLLNGRRLASGGILRALSDPSMISANATERLEVVLDGSSAIYGADAVAGVVNLITRKRFDGAETTLRYGAGDGINEKIASQNWGRTWASGDVFVALEYSDRSDLARADRASILTQDLRPFGGLDQRSTQAQTPNIVVAGVRLPLPTLTGPSNRYDGLDGDFLPEQRRYNGFLSARQKIGSDVEVWYEGFFSRRLVITDNAPLGGTFSVPATNPFYRTGVPGVAPGANETVEYRLPRPGAQNHAKEVGAQSAVGLRWSLPADWQLNTYVSRSYDEGVSGLASEQLNNFAIARALADTNPATSLNVFGGPISAATYAQIIGFRLQKTDTLNNHFEAKVDGPLFDLPGGKVRSAVGVSYDKGSFRYQEYQSVLSPTNTPSTTNDRKNHREVKSAYGELFVPIVSGDNAMPLVQRLDLSLAGRYDDYSDFGNTFNPKVSVVWEPARGFALRGTWGKSYRAPSLTDTGNLNFLFVQSVPDPANGNRPVNQLLWTGSNPDLKPEKAKTYSVGFDWTPTFLPNLRASATYYKVNYKDRIQGISATLANEALYSQFIIRNPPRALVESLFNSGWLVTTAIDPAQVGVLVDGRRNNVGVLIQDGLDIDVRYTLPTSFGDFAAGVTHSEVFHAKRKSLPSLPFAETVNTFENPLRSRGRASLSWRNGGLSANLFYNYGGSYIDTAIVPNVKAKVQTTVDAGVAYLFGDGSGAMSKGLRIGLNVQNLFDKDPPVVLNGTNRWDNTTASAIGRFISVDVTKRW